VRQQHAWRAARASEFGAHLTPSAATRRVFEDAWFETGSAEVPETKHAKKA